MLRSLLEGFRPKVTTIKESKDIDSMRIDELFYKNQESGKGQRPNKQSFNEKRKSSSKGKKIECYNCGGLRHYDNDCSSPKDAKKFMLATWSNIDFEGVLPQLQRMQGNQKPRSQPSSSKSPLRTKQVWLRNDRSKCQVMFNALKAKSSSEWHLDNGCSRHKTRDTFSFTSLENYNGGIITFGDGSLARVKGKDSIGTLGCPKLNGVLYVKGLKDNLKDLEITKDNPNDILERNIDPNNDEFVPLDETFEETRSKLRSKVPKNHPISNVIANVNERVVTRR
ncbi:hypothetical protein CK203_084454 [Vitis vinifera]|uniref:Retrovirus-related Pol polyprotein from transposon TNT 1-94-like beta-barrel domain-containing protein n=1 Tax=Vitis vinifera TaxID=29760 RepID=A0A438EMY3_VITVI|nr:hypothetical protein CK203_084454 [Vitis vinifera]